MSGATIAFSLSPQNNPQPPSSLAPSSPSQTRRRSWSSTTGTSSAVSPPSATISDAPNTPSPSSSSLHAAPSSSSTASASVPLSASATGAAAAAVAAAVVRPAAGPRQPTNFSEWQLLAVLYRANLVQYYDTFIAQGGDDINQIMQCDEAEFLEIMSLVGMLSKPLHVRRLQRTLTEFSKDPSTFNLSAVQSIGPPPVVSSYGLAPADAAALQFLLPGLASHFLPTSSPGLLVGETSPGSSSAVKADIGVSLPSSSSHSATANVLAGELLNSLVSTSLAQQNSSSALSPGEGPSSVRTRASTSPSVGGIEDFVALGDFDPNTALPTDTPSLSEAQIRRLAQCAANLVARLPHSCKPKLVQNKKKISKELLDVITQPGKIEDFRKYAAIYGRFDAKRKPDKPLSLHEVSVNEAAAQICLLQPALLTRRDELFPLARQAVKDAGYHYVKGMRREEGGQAGGAGRRRTATEVFSDRSSPRSLHSSVSPSPSPGLVEEETEDPSQPSTSGLSEASSRKRVHSNGDSQGESLKVPRADIDVVKTEP